MSVDVKPLFIVVDDIKSDREDNIRNIKLYDPEADIKEFSHPYFFKDWLEDQRQQGVDLAQRPKVFCFDGTMQALVSWGRGHGLTEYEQEKYGAGYPLSNQTEMDKLKDVHGALTTISGEDLGDYVVANISNSLERAQEEAEEYPRNPDRLSSAEYDDMLFFIKDHFNPEKVARVVNYLDQLIQLKTTQ